MDWNWVILITALNFIHIFGKEVTVQVNTKKSVHYVPERFLSMTLDPVTIAAASPLTQVSLNMARGLSPSFVRIGGAGTNKLVFGKEFQINGTSVTEEQWDSVNRFMGDANLELIISLNPSIKSHGSWDPRNTMELITYSDQHGYNVAWQLGYDLYGANATGEEIGRDLVRLRKLLDDYTHYSNSPVFGPDIPSVSGTYQIHFVKDLINQAGTALGSIILQPKFRKYSHEDPGRIIDSMLFELDSFVWNKDNFRLGRSTPKKPVWIAESEPSDGTFHEAMQLARKLGSAAKLGVQVYLRQAGKRILSTPTADFWFSLLYKTLVGRGVLETKMSGNRSEVHLYSHCTKSIPNEKSVLDSDWNYEKGALTMFGVNESPETMKLNMKSFMREELIHMYVLTKAMKNPNSDNPQEVTLLNGEELMLSPTWDLPVLSPRVRRPSRSSTITVPGNSIFFIVLPEHKARTCTIAPVRPSIDLPLFTELTKKIKLLVPTPEKNENGKVKSEEDFSVSEEEENQKFVKFNKKRHIDSESSKNMKKLDLFDDKYKTLAQKLFAKFPMSKKQEEPKVYYVNNENEDNVKYITFNDNSWLNKLTETMSKTMEKDVLENEDDRAAQLDKFAALAKAAKKVESSEIPNESSEESSTETLKSRPKRFSKDDSANTEQLLKELHDGKKSDEVETIRKTLSEVKVSYDNSKKKKRQITNEKKEEEEAEAEKNENGIDNKQPPIVTELENPKSSSMEVIDQPSQKEVDVAIISEINKENPVGEAETIDVNKPDVKPTPEVTSGLDEGDSTDAIADDSEQKKIDEMLSEIVIKENTELSKHVADPSNIESVDEQSIPVPDSPDEMSVSPKQYKTIIPVEESGGALEDPPNSLNSESPPGLPDDSESTIKVARQAESASTPGEPTEPAGSDTLEEAAPDAATEPPPLKAVKKYELYIKERKERLAALRAKLKSTRAKWQEEIKKAAATGDQEKDIKSTIQRREAELKEIFRKLEKREIPVTEIEDKILEIPVIEELQEPLEEPHHRFRRLTITADNIERIMGDMPQSSYNVKRSYQVHEPNDSSAIEWQQIPNQVQNPELNKYWVPINIKSQGIVYNNRIYPRKLFPLIGVSPPPIGPYMKGLSPTGPPPVSVPDKPHPSHPQVATPIAQNPVPQSSVQQIPIVASHPPPQPNSKPTIEEVQERRRKRSTIEEKLTNLQNEFIPKLVSMVDKLKETLHWKRDIYHGRHRRSIDFNPNDIYTLLNSPKLDLKDNYLPHQTRVKSPEDPAKTDPTCQEIGTSKESTIKDNEDGGGDEIPKIFASMLFEKFKSILKSVHEALNKGVMDTLE